MFFPQPLTGIGSLGSPTSFFTKHFLNTITSLEISAEQVLPSAELTRQGVGNYWVGHGKLLNVEKKSDKATKMSSRTLGDVWIFTAT